MKLLKRNKMHSKSPHHRSVETINRDASITSMKETSTSRNEINTSSSRAINSKAKQEANLNKDLQGVSFHDNSLKGN